MRQFENIDETFLEQPILEDVAIEEVNDADVLPQFATFAAEGRFFRGHHLDHEDLDGPLLPKKCWRTELNGERDPSFLAEPFAVT